MIAEPQVGFKAAPSVRFSLLIVWKAERERAREREQEGGGRERERERRWKWMSVNGMKARSPFNVRTSIFTNVQGFQTLAFNSSIVLISQLNDRTTLPSCYISFAIHSLMFRTSQILHHIAELSSSSGENSFSANPYRIFNYKISICWENQGPNQPNVWMWMGLKQRAIAALIGRKLISRA